jgi:hypothetical protein
VPTTDAYGQGIQLASLTDAPDLPKAISDVANGTIPRGVMRFASASARGATLSSPAAGMVAWLQDSKYLTLYDGSAWVVISAGTQAWTAVSLASGFSNTDNNSQGNLMYRVVNLFGEPTLMFKGGLHVAYSGSPSAIANGGYVTSTPLPATARPTNLRSLTGACSTVSSDVLSVKIDVGTDGRIQIVGTTTATANPKIQPPWVSFNSIFCSL